MATVVKDFKVKAGLVVEGATATVNGKNILRQDDSDQYIIDLIGGETLITSVDAADFTVTAKELSISPASDIARTGDLPTETADISESVAGPLYFTNQRALDATAAAYDASGAAATVAGDLTDHENATVAHGVTGDVVGTTDTQVLSNKSISGNLHIKNQDDTNTGRIFASGTTMYFNAGNGKNIQIAGQNINLYGDGGSAYIGSTSAENEIATHGYADQAETDAKNYADGLATNYDAAGSATTAEGNAKDYTDLLLGDATIDGTGGNTVTARIATAVANLVDSAPAALDTLNELAAALGDDVDLVTGLATSIGNKLPLAGGTLTGALAMGTNKITGLGTPTADTDAATKKYVDDQTTTDVAEGTNLYFTNQRALDATAAAYDAAGAAAQALTNAEAYADALTTADIAEGVGNLYFTNQRAIDAVGGTIEGAIDLLDTDDIEEGGTNLYFTDGRAKTSAAELLVGASLTNITITGTGNGLTITAENGVADSDTDDLTEGTTNLYFTDVRAVDALEAVVPNFTAVEVNSLAKQIAATVSAPTGGSQVTAYAFAKATYRSAKFLVKTAYGTHTELSEVLITLDTSDNIAITEYAIVGTNGSSSTITADVDGGNVRLRVTPTNNTSTVTVVGTLLA